MLRVETKLLRTTGSVAIVAASLLLSAGYGLAQKKEAKQAAAFRDDVKEIQASITKAKHQLETTVAAYNDLLKEGNTKTKPAHKKLVGEIGKSESMVAGIRKKKDSLTKTGDKFFTAWDAGVRKLSSESLKTVSQERLNATRQAYSDMLDNMKAAGEAYEPVITSLKDQATLMGQDLSPETLATLREKAAPGLNKQAEELFAKIDKILNAEQEKETKVDESLDAETNADESALEDQTSQPDKPEVSDEASD